MWVADEKLTINELVPNYISFSQTMITSTHLQIQIEPNENWAVFVNTQRAFINILSSSV